MITVVIDPTKFDNPVLRGLDTLARLRDRGVPVIGVLWPEAVESGKLTVSEPDLADGTVRYSWHRALFMGPNMSPAVRRHVGLKEMLGVYHR